MGQGELLVWGLVRCMGDVWLHGYRGWAYGCMGIGVGIWMHGYRGWASLLVRVDTYKVCSCLDISQ